jgi:hypothetical protein
MSEGKVGVGSLPLSAQEIAPWEMRVLDFKLNGKTFSALQTSNSDKNKLFARIQESEWRIAT